MKLLLILVVCVAIVLGRPSIDKQKREILPGDPRYGTDYHHQHHHREHENEVEILKAVGGHIGSYKTPDDTEDHSFQVPQSSYGPPSYKPGQPLGSDYLAPSDAIKSSAVFHQVPSTSYGVPDTIQTLHTNNVNTEQSVEAPITSYATAKQEEHVQIPHTSYGALVEKPSFENVQVQNTVIPKVQHVQQQQPIVHKYAESVSVPQAKVTTPHLSVQTQDVAQHSSLKSVPSFTSVSNYPGSYSYSSYSNIPVQTVDHHVHVQVPEPYAVPVTKHVAYPVPVPHTVEVPKPYYVRVPQPVQVTVNRPYPVEVPRAIPYPVPQYVRSSVPVIQRHHVETIKANPVQDFFDNTQSTFQNVLDNLPSFQNPLQDFQNPFDNIELPPFPSLPSVPSVPSFPSFPSFPSIPSIPSIPSFPSLPSVPSQPSQSQGRPTIPVISSNIDVSTPANSDSVTVENPTLKIKTTVPTSQSANTYHSHAQSVAKQSTACAGCSVSASSKKEYVQPVDANGGYVY